jgi:hypothetical protein
MTKIPAKFLWMLLGALLVSACATTIRVPYVPSDHMTREQARTVIRQAFEEQPEKYRPVTVNVGDDAIRLGFATTQGSLVTGGITTIQKSETYYFSNLIAPQLIKRNEQWRVLLENKEGTVDRWVYFYEQRRATEFFDAVSRMSSLAMQSGSQPASR